jgi:tetratricopeptide (TPR) repeat protein
LPLLLRLAPFFALSLVLGLVTVWFQTHRAIGGDAIRSADFPTRLAGAGQAVGFYFQKLLWPLDLCFVYPEWKTEPGSPTAWLPLLGLLAVFGLGGLFRRGWGRHLLFASGWFVLLLLPVLGFVDIYFHRYAPVADHWAYFAGIGIIVGVVSTGAHLFQRHKRKGVVWLLPATAVAAVAWMGTATWRQAGVYHDLGTLWTDTLGKNPNCWLAHNSLGSLLANAGYLDDARVHYERALAIKPDAPEVLNNVASVRLDQGRPDEAIVLLRRVLDVSPRSAMAHYNLGNAYDQQGDADTAEKHYRRALELDPAHAEAHSNLGCLLYATGRKSEAIDAFAHAISLRPDYAEALNNLGAIFLEQGRFQQAESLLLEAVRHKPDYSDAWFNLGNAVLPQGRTREAVVAYRRVLALSPRHALAHCRLGSALWHDGNPSDALAELDRALKLQPDLAEAHHQTGIILASGQKPALAVSHLRRAVELQPDWPEALAGLAFTLATAASEKDRDGAEALRVAGRAVELTRRTNFIALDALAAALAETATFEEATRTAGLAAELATTAGDTNRAEQIHLRQKLYESGKPHRQ